MAQRQAIDPDLESRTGPPIPSNGLERLPAELETPRSKLVYLALWTCGESTVDDLETTVELSKLTLLPILTALVEAGLVDRDGPRYVVER